MSLGWAWVVWATLLWLSWVNLQGLGISESYKTSSYREKACSPAYHSWPYHGTWGITMSLAETKLGSASCPLAPSKTSARDFWSPGEANDFLVLCFCLVIIPFSSSKWNWKHVIWIREHGGNGGYGTRNKTLKSQSFKGAGEVAQSNSQNSHTVNKIHKTCVNRGIVCAWFL